MAEALEQIAAQTGSLYQTRQPVSIDIYTGGFLEMYDMGGTNDHGRCCVCPMCQVSNRMALDHMPGQGQINPVLDGGVMLDLNKSKGNTYTLKQYVDGVEESIARYIHHDRGPGRVDTP